MSSKDFLVEIGTEELPPKALKKLATAFMNNLVDGLSESGLGGSDAKFFASPRRLAVYVNNVLESQADRIEERRGPALQASFKEDGTATNAAIGFAKSCGTTVSLLETLKTDKGAWLVFRQNVKGQSASELIPNLVNRSLEALPIPKKMRWGSSTHEFVRPVHWVVLLFGNTVIPGEIFGHKTGRETRGHRFHCNTPLVIPNPAAYKVLLETEGKVIADFEQRRNTIRAEVEQTAVQLNGKAIIDESLLDEVTGLVEYPNVVVGKFDSLFLEVPAEALISAMKTHQKYFHVIDSNGNLLPNFITIANIDSKNVVSVRDGNERVIRPRLSDADFFWKQDKKVKLHSRAEHLGNVIFQHKLGSVLDKVVRIEDIAKIIATKIGCDVEKASRAALLCKCDLLSAMVNEFPELQGTMGFYYAKNDGEDEGVARAIQDHYLPRYSGDDVARTQLGQTVSIADKIDTIVSIFSINEQPSGDKDPFGLRRAAVGILRTIIENRLDLDLVELVSYGVAALKKQQKSVSDVDEIIKFIFERMKSYFADKNIAADSFESVYSVLPTRPFDFALRVDAVEKFKTLPEATSLAAANKRIRNILKKSNTKIEGTVVVGLLSQKEETALYDALTNLEKQSKKYIEVGDYTKALTVLSQIRREVDKFFDKVMVNVEDFEIRNNRLALLSLLNYQFDQIADISKLRIAGDEIRIQ